MVNETERPAAQAGPGLRYDMELALQILERTPAVLSALLAGLADAWTAPNEGSETFSAYENVAHLLHGEHSDWIPRARLILEQGADRRFAPFDRFAHRRESAGRSLPELLDELAHTRARNIALLRGWNITERELDLTGEHPAFGTVTLRQLLATWVVHDLGHTAQIARVMAKQYRAEVGPWREYLPILDRP